LQDAIIYFHEALKLKPENLETCINLAGIYLRKRDENNAIKYYEQVLKINPHNEEAKYLIAALKSENLSIAPTQYVQHLFDNYANHFDQHLQLLKYKVPEEIYNEIIKILGKEIKNLVILDFGCGTGLAGEKFSLHADKIIGIDLSERMLEIAKQKNIYDELKMGNENDIINYPHIDLIIAADTFVYIGDLDKMFANCRKILKLGGLLAFTTEQTDHYPYLLQKTARFAHSISYLNELSIKNNFTILINKNIIARTNEGNEVKCNLFIVKILTH
jgi:predicted TPR repeat methyltransferase